MKREDDFVWSRYSAEEVLHIFSVEKEKGLSQEQVEKYRVKYGANVFEKGEHRTLFDIFLDQWKNPLAVILLVAMFATLALGERVDALVIFCALAINVVIGVFQEGRAGHAFEELKKSQEHRASVLRNGVRLILPAEEVVVGDVVFLEGGNYVPADVRIIEEKDVRINESALTGEWLAVEKDAGALTERVPLSERTNMAWMGTLLESGYGVGVVVAVGKRSRLGDIAGALTTGEETETPLQKNMRHLARTITTAVLCALVGILVLGMVRGESFHGMLLVAIAIAVAAVPVGLPASVTVTLAVGMEAMLKRGGLVRNLLATETLGSVTTILTDKTGTLTEARMKLSGLFSLEGIREKKEHPFGDNHFLLELGVLQSDALVSEGEGEQGIAVQGRPLEKAFVLAGLEVGIAYDVARATSPLVDRLQFTSVRRFGASLHHNPQKKALRLICAGEPELLVRSATLVRAGGKRIACSEKIRAQFLEVLRKEARAGRRVIALSYRDTNDSVLEESMGKELLEETVLAGLVAFEDPLRADVPEAIRKVQGAGARVIMLTGDNPETARTVAEKVGICGTDDTVVLGSELDAWDDATLREKMRTVRVVARAVPEHKLRIARILREDGETIAMTGDGINDAPALRLADIGVAVGSGTEVAKEASDMVLVNDSFSILVSAIEEGRRIIDNVRKVVVYLLSTSFSEIFVMVGALAGGLPVPLVPAQILWANIVGGDLIGFSFAFEKKDPRVMERTPQEAKTLLTRRLFMLVSLLTVVSGVVATGLFYILIVLGTPLSEIRTVMFVVLSLDALFFSLSLKSLDTPLWRIPFLSNVSLVWALFISVSLLFLALFFAPLRSLLSLTSLTLFEGFLLVGVGLLNLTLIEGAKAIFFMRGTKHTVPIHATLHA